MASGIFWSFAGAIVTRGLSLPASILVARILGREVFGEIGVINGTVGMFGVFAGFGLGLTTTKYVAEFRTKDLEKTARIMSVSSMTALVTGGVMSLLLLILAPWLAERTLAAPHLGSVLRITTVSLFFGALNGTQVGTLAGFEAFKVIARVHVLAAMAHLPLMVGGAYFAGLHGAVWGMAIATFVNWLLNHIAIRLEAQRFKIPSAVSERWKEWKILWNFSAPSVLSGAMVGPVNWLCFAMLVNQTNGYVEMGIFNAANQWRTAILFLPNLIGNIALPILSSLTGANDKRSYRRILFENLFVNAAITLFATIIISLFATVILGFYGHGFVEGKYSLIILCCATVFMAMNNVIGQSIASVGKMWNGFLFNSLWAIVLIICTYYLLGRGLGATGLSLAILISYIAHSCWQGVYVYRFLQRQGLSSS